MIRLELLGRRVRGICAQVLVLRVCRFLGGQSEGIHARKGGVGGGGRGRGGRGGGVDSGLGGSLEG